MERSINRYELKYLLPLSQAERIVGDLAEMTVPDPHGAAGGYRVASLYYDSPDLDFFWAKIEGIKYRRKLRLRVYPGEDPRAVERGVVEIKQRINRTVQKRRIPLALNDAERLCSGEWPTARLAGFDRQVASEVLYLVRAMHLRPTAITAYHRRAFLGGPNERRLRVTFDTDCRGRVGELGVDRQASNHLFLPPDWCVMEVKVDEAVPDWVTSLLARYGCQIRRISKYCAALAKGRGIRVMPLAVQPARSL